MTTRADVASLRAELAAAAQTAYDEWEQDADGMDPDLGQGGICDVVADRMAAVLHARLPDIETSREYVEADCHVVIVVRADDGVLRVDIPAGTYETGTGYVWRKLPDVVIEAGDVVVDVLSDDADQFFLYASDASCPGLG